MGQRRGYDQGGLPEPANRIADDLAQTSADHLRDGLPDTFGQVAHLLGEML